MNLSIFRLILVLCDIFSIVSGFLLAYYIRFYTFIKVSTEIPGFGLYLFAVPFILTIQIFVFSRSGLYDSNRFDMKFHYIKLIEGISFSTFIILSMSFIFREISYSRLTFFIFIFTEFFILIFLRIIVLSIKKRMIMRNIGRKNILFIGCSCQGMDLIHRLNSEKYRLYNIMGYISTPSDPENKDNLDIPCLGQISETRIEEICIKYNISLIIVAVSCYSNDLIWQLEKETAQLNVQLRIVTEFGDIFTRNIYIEEFYNELTMVIMHSPLGTDQRYIKDGFDMIFSLLVLILASPIMLIIALMVKITSPGNTVIYKQIRTGADGKSFEMLKFRTMHSNAEDNTGPVWATKDDSRVTWLGKILRKTSLDELPQFINVLRGQMSVVGPRPERPVFVEKFKEKYPTYLFRHKIKSGITGWAQINGLRGNTDLEKRLKYDLYYLENWSILFDLKIIILTIPEVLFSKYAY